jgi:Mrp family chromosome partitioning ATPase
VRKTDIENLDVLPAGLTLGRPAEVLSRTETPQIVAMFSELYDHVVFDTAPLLPVSDTHVLLGMVDGVICSFNADVDKETVAQMEEILRRSHATVIGSVMNQVKFRQTSSYQRGKSAYSSYYNSDRPSEAAAATAPSAAATIAAPAPQRPELPGAGGGDAMAGA